MEEAERQGREDNKSEPKERATLEKVVLELEAAPALPRVAPSVPASEPRPAPAPAASRAEGVERTRRRGMRKHKRKE